MVGRIDPPELHLNKAIASNTEAPFLDVHLSISNGFVSSKIYDKRDDFDFGIVKFLFFGRERSTFYLLRVFTFLNLFNLPECLVMLLYSMHVIKILIGKLLHQSYRYHKLRKKKFSKFYRRHYELVSKIKVRLKSLLQQGLSEPEFYVRKIVSGADFSDQFRKVIMRYNIIYWI